jgi:hypothetical protein
VVVSVPDNPLLGFSSRPKPALGRVFARMFTTESGRSIGLLGGLVFLSAVNSRFKRRAAKNGNRDCTKFWHPPVDELHSIENTADKIARKELTYKSGTRTNTLVL